MSDAVERADRAIQVLQEGIRAARYCASTIPCGCAVDDISLDQDWLQYVVNEIVAGWTTLRQGDV